MNRCLRALCCGSFGLVLGLSGANAQLALPGAAPAASKGTTATVRAKDASAAKKGAARTGKGAKTAAAAAPDVANLAGQPLLHNGGMGLLQISGDASTARIDKLRLAGETVSDPTQRCVVDIVGEKPIAATAVGRPDGLERFEADVPACPFAFDVLNGAALVPPQITACVFKAADCQTNPSGLWGPDGSSLEKDAAGFARQRADAEKSMAKVLRAIEDRADNNPDAANLLRDQSAFAGQRDDACRDYVKESAHGYCATRLTEARTALLEARLDALGPATGAKADKSTAEKKRKKKEKKAKADAAAD